MTPPEAASGLGAGLIDELRWRGLFHSATPGLAARLADSRPVAGYIGFDPSGPSLHVGHLVPIFGLLHLQRHGGRPIALVGGGTGMIGDPSGTSAERNLLTREMVLSNTAAIRDQLERFLDFEGPTGALMADNHDWLGSMRLLDFLRDVGKHFRVNTMLRKDAVSARLASDAGISYTEFSYQILQGMDYLELYRRYGCRLQTGGSDQWGNLTAGTDLIHRVTGDSVHLVATPLITDAAGDKIGKSTGGGSVWLDPAMTSPYAFYQYFLNVEDALVPTLLRTLTFLDREEIVALEKETAQQPAARAGQRRLAAEVTRTVHGEVETRAAVDASQALFGRGSLAELPAGALRAALVEAGLTVVPGPAPTIAVLLKESGLVGGMNEARRAIAEGGAYVNNERVADPAWVPPAEVLLHGRYLVLRRGRRTVAGVELTS